MRIKEHENINIQQIENIAAELKIDCVIAVADKLTTFGGGGSAQVLYPRNKDELLALLNGLMRLGVEPFILGGGSNVIMADGFISVPFISTERLNTVRFDDDIVHAECGVRLPRLIRLARERGLGGLEYLAGVPASVGGALRMNAGAFSQQIGDRVLRLDTITKRCTDANMCIYAENEVSAPQFAYRSGVCDIVTACELRLDRMTAEESSIRARQYIYQRKLRQPRLPSCGSVFKNGSVPSGKLIEECGLKGKQCGAAEISKQHANFIVNHGGATAEDFITLVQLAENAVYEKFGITLEREFVYIED